MLCKRLETLVMKERERLCPKLFILVLTGSLVMGLLSPAHAAANRPIVVAEVEGKVMYMLHETGEWLAVTLETILVENDIIS